MKKEAFPLTVKNGNSIVKIYHSKNGGYEEFKVSYYFQGKRKLETFSSFTKARKRAGEINDSVNSGDTESLLLTPSERTEYTQAKERLQPLGISLSVAALNFVEAQKILGSVPLLKAAQYYLQKHPTNLAQRTVTEAVAEFLALKKQKGVGERHLYKLTLFFSGRQAGRKRNLKAKGSGLAFAEAFNCPLPSISGLEVSKFLDSLCLCPHEYNNRVSFLRDFFAFARKKNYVPLDWGELEALEARKVQDWEIGIYSPTEIALILSAAEDHRMRTVLAICAFSGMRTAEATRLDWAQIGAAGGDFIEVKGRISKTRQRRLIPLTPNLKAWLTPYLKLQGPVWPLTLKSFATMKGRVLRSIPFFTPKANGLRHSYISYRMAQTSNAASVSLEAGNTPEIIFRHYRQLVSPEQAEKWFAVMPREASEKIIHLKTAAA